MNKLKIIKMPYYSTKKDIDFWQTKLKDGMKDDDSEIKKAGLTIENFAFDEGDKIIVKVSNEHNKLTADYLIKWQNLMKEANNHSGYCIFTADTVKIEIIKKKKVCQKCLQKILGDK